MYRKNVASQYIYFALIDASTGAAMTGATVAAYRALDGAAQASATGTTSDLGNGQYRFNLSQADTNADYGSFLFTATGAVPVEKTVVFTAANPTDAVRFGLTALPNAAAGASGGLIINGSNSGTVTLAALVVSGTTTLTGAVTVTAGITGNITGNLSGSVGSVSGLTASDVGAIKTKTDNLPSDPADQSLIISATDAVMSRLGTPAGASIAADIAGVSGGGGLDAAGVRAAVGLASANLDTQLAAIGDAVDTEVAAIKAKTDGLPSDPADASVIAARFDTIDTTLSTLAGYVDTEVAAIKAKTDNLPSDPADQSLLIAATDAIKADTAAIKLKTDNLPSDPADASVIAGLIGALPDATDIVDAILAGTVDSVTIESLLEALLAVVAGKASVAGSVVTFYKRDGTTAKAAITYGGTPGQRTGSTLS